MRLGLILGAIMAASLVPKTALVTQDAAAQIIVHFEGQHKHSVNDLSFSDDRKILASVGVERAGLSLRFWDVATSDLLHEVTFDARGDGRAAEKLCPVFPNRTIVYASYPYPRQSNTAFQVRRFNLKKKDDYVVTSFEADELAVGLWRDRIALHNSTKHTLRIYDWETGKPRTFQAQESFDVKGYSPDGKRAVLLHAKNLVSIVDLGRCEQLAKFSIGDDGLRVSTLTPDGKTLVLVPKAAFKHTEVHLWDVEQGKLKQVRKLHGFLNKLTFIKEGRILAAMSDSEVEFYDLKMQQLLPPMIYGSQELTCIQFAPEEKTYATGDRSGRVRLFKTPELKEQK